ncbi:MAG: adenylate cyclase [Candidatus Epulonipiscioides saccharophilum]|nr:MAG: adenylate cyclase [Epulopiscium sp. AS2M-Bin001]
MDMFGIWFLMGAALVFFMQAGFAMVETGFTRAKNTGNIIMKNLMDFCLGTIAFAFLGYGLMMSDNYFLGVIGIPDLDIFFDYANFEWSSFVFNVVFCATTATIVSGAMAERTKFSAYLIYSLILSLIVYPIEAGWVWNPEGWLYQLGFIDFAGSAVIHTVGGISSLVGIKFLGARIGKYVKDPDTGKIISKAIPGHNLTIGALGCFILWFGWYGFNGAAATSLEGIGGLGSIFLTTTIAPAAASLSTMAYTWIKNGKPDVSMTLNGSLAGLVAVTAGCATLDAFGALMVGLVAGILVVVSVEFIDLKLRLDDPVGAVSVHGINGIWGTLAVGLFAVEGGLFYGGGTDLLLIQTIGIGSIILYTAIVMIIFFALIDRLHGLRVSVEEETVGLDLSEHALDSSYAGFAMTSMDIMPAMTLNSELEIDQLENQPVTLSDAIPIINNASVDTKITKVTVVTNQAKFYQLKMALESIGITGMTVIQVLGFGIQKGQPEYYRGNPVTATLLPKVKIEIVICKIPTNVVVDTIIQTLYTGHIGDGKIFISDVENVYRISTNEQGYDALQD